MPRPSKKSTKRIVTENVCKKVMGLIDDIESAETAGFSKAELDREQEISRELRRCKFALRNALRYGSAANQYQEECAGNDKQP